MPGRHLVRGLGDAGLGRAAHLADDAGRRRCGHRRHRPRGDRGRTPSRRRDRGGSRRQGRAAPGLWRPRDPARAQPGHRRHDLRCRLAHQGDGDGGGHPATRRTREDRSRQAGRRLLACLRGQRQVRHHRAPASHPLRRAAGRHSDANLVRHRGRARHDRGAETAGARRHAVHLQRRRLHRVG